MDVVSDCQSSTSFIWSKTMPFTTEPLSRCICSPLRIKGKTSGYNSSSVFTIQIITIQRGSHADNENYRDPWDSQRFFTNTLWQPQHFSRTNLTDNNRQFIQAHLSVDTVRWYCRWDRELFDTDVHLLIESQWQWSPFNLQGTKTNCPFWLLLLSWCHPVCSTHSCLNKLWISLWAWCWVTIPEIQLQIS